MKKQIGKKLQLSRETLHHLTADQLNAANGGQDISGTLTCGTSARCEYVEISTTRAGYCTITVA